MAGRYRRLDGAELKDRRTPESRFALDVLYGLSSSPKRLPSKYLYDDRGSALFAKITSLPDYYPTGCEKEILENHATDLARIMSAAPFDLVELGSGDGHKTQVLLQAFQAAGCDFRYVPIDISEAAVRGLIDTLSSRHPRLEVEGLVSEYFTGIEWLGRLQDRPTLVLFAGSNIGNFSRPEANVFLRTLWNGMNEGDRLLVGFDLKKDIEVMLRAYNDPQGVTREFNLNLLDRINRELGGDFDPDKFRFYSTYEVAEGSMNSYLVSLDRQNVFVETIGQVFQFEAWEPLQTEYSYKYLESDIDMMARVTGFEITDRFYDSRRFFTNSLWRVRKRSQPAA